MCLPKLLIVTNADHYCLGKWVAHSRGGNSLTMEYRYPNKQVLTYDDVITTLLLTIRANPQKEIADGVCVCDKIIDQSVERSSPLAIAVSDTLARSIDSTVTFCRLGGPIHFNSRSGWKSVMGITICLLHWLSRAGTSN